MIEITEPDDPRDAAPMLLLLRDQVTEAEFTRRLEAAISDGYRVKLALKTGEPVGALGYRVTHDIFWGRSLFVDDLVVRPEMRSEGIGAMLMNAAHEEASARQCDHIRLCSGLTREAAHRFYEMNGYARKSFQFARPVEEF